MHDKKPMASDEDGVDEPNGTDRGVGGEGSRARNDVVTVARAVASIVGNARPADTVAPPQEVPTIPVADLAAPSRAPAIPTTSPVGEPVAVTVPAPAPVNAPVPSPIPIPAPASIPAVMRINVTPAIDAASGSTSGVMPIGRTAHAPEQSSAWWRTGGRFAHLSQWLVVGLRVVGLAFAGWLLAMVVLIGAYAFLNPTGSALMAIRWMGGTSIAHQWVPLERISPRLVTAVIVSEDGRFCRHWGIDPQEIRAAIKRSRGGVPRGASTITMQLAKNLFLWPDKSYVRKVLEIPLTLAIELFWTKRRIVEVYLNVVELGPGIFGVEAAARHYFKKSAKSLSSEQASLLSVSLPAPLRRNALKPTRQVRRMARVVRARMRHSGYAARCVLKPR